MTGDLHRCLVLGASGFLGQHVVSELRVAGIVTRSFIRSSTKSGLSCAGDGSETYYGNFLAPEHLARAFEGCDSCIHLITTTFPRTANADVVYDVESNLVGTLRLLELARFGSCKKIVYISSGGTVYGSPSSVPIREDASLAPISAYGLTKATIENYLGLYRNAFGVESVVLRVANPYGPYQRSDGSQGLISSFLRATIEGRSVQLYGDGSQQRDYVYISDVARAVRMALTARTELNTFNIGSGVGRSVSEIVAMIEMVTGRALDIQRMPANPVDVQLNYLDNRLAREELQWTPLVDIEEGILRTFNWLSSVYGSQV